MSILSIGSTSISLKSYGEGGEEEKQQKQYITIVESLKKYFIISLSF
jgi:hypothetical protein